MRLGLTWPRVASLKLACEGLEVDYGSSRYNLPLAECFVFRWPFRFVPFKGFFNVAASSTMTSEVVSGAAMTKGLCIGHSL